MKRHQGITNNILQLVGQTPLVKLHQITKEFQGEFYAKLEAFNPGHSTKDRIALYIIEEAEKDVLAAEADGKRPIYAPGYFTMVGNEIIHKVNRMTLKKHQD